MFLTPPTIEELVTLDLPTLIDMLTTHTTIHTDLLKENGLTPQSKASMEIVLCLQAAIETKKMMENNVTETTPPTTFTQDITTAPKE